MKPNLSRSLAIYAALQLFLTGCHGVPSPATSAEITAAVQLAVTDGARLVLAEHPEKRPVFVAVRDALVALHGNPSVTFGALHDAFAPLLAANVRELRSPRAALLVDVAVIAVDGLAARTDISPASRSAEILAVADAGAAALTRVLAQTPNP